MAWRKPMLRDIAAKLNQRELDAYRLHPDFATGTDPVIDLMEQTAEMVRGYCRSNRQIQICPRLATIPEGLMSFAMDYCAFDIIKRINVKPNEARTLAYEKALETFKDVASGAFIPESYIEGDIDDTQSNRATPKFAKGRHKILDSVW